MNTKATVQRTLILEFTLPGMRGGGMSRCVPHEYGAMLERPRQQLERISETHRIELDADNAQQTLDVLRDLTMQVELLIATGGLK